HLILRLLVCICRRIRTFQCLEQDVHFIEHFFHLFRGGFQFFQRFFKCLFLAKGGGKHLFQHRRDVLQQLLGISGLVRFVHCPRQQQSGNLLRCLSLQLHTHGTVFVFHTV